MSWPPKGSYKGPFIPKNTDKYVGDVANITYRSSWEKKVMRMLDENPNVLQWASEEVIIMYHHPLKDRMARYYPDFYVKLRKKDGTISQGIIEVKPKKECTAPQGKRRTRRLINESATYAINRAKWEAATEYCALRGWFFQLMTEDDIFK
jgi:hypothetical protein